MGMMNGARSDSTRIAVIIIAVRYAIFNMYMTIDAMSEAW